MVSGSRISPTTMTSGACRRAARRAVGKSGASTPIHLLDHASPMRMLVLDRVLDCDDVAGVSMVDLIHERRHGGRLPRAGGTADEHQAARKPAERQHGWGQAERRQTRDGGGKAADRRRRAAALAMEVDAEASQIGTPIRGVRDARLAELALGVRRQSRAYRLRNLIAVQRSFCQRHDDPVDAD